MLVSFTNSVVRDYLDKFGINKLQFGLGFLFFFFLKLSPVKMFLQIPSHQH